MKKSALLCFILAAGSLLPTRVHATGIPVVDALHVSVSEINWIQNLAQWFESAANQVEQISNQVEQINQMVDYLERFGNPEELIGQLGLDELLHLGELASIADSYQSIVDNVEGTYAMTRTAQGMFERLPDRIAGGLSLELNPDTFRKYAAHGQMVDSYYQRSEDLRTAREEIQTQIDQTLEQVDSASTDAEVARLTAKLTALAAQQEQLSREETLAAAQSTVAANDIAISANARRQASASAYDKQYEAVMEEATQGTIPEPKSSGSIPD